LANNGVITNNVAERMKAMVGFRNIAVHDYQKRNIIIVQKVIEVHLSDFDYFTKAILKLARKEKE